MPLRLVKRGGIWYVRGTVRGVRCFRTAGTADQAHAEAFRAKYEAELYESAIFGQRAVVSFQRAALSYLKGGPRSDRTEFYAHRLIDHFGNAKIGAIGQAEADAAARALVGAEAAPATVNREVLTPLRAILNFAADRRWCDGPRIASRPVPRADTPWLTPRQALTLLEAAAPHLKPLLLFLLGTGARMSEALDLDWRDVHLVESRAIFRDTKNGRDRLAALPPRTLVALANLNHRDGKVFRRGDGKPYVDRERQEGGQIKTGFRAACRRAQIGQLGLSPHDLRHTWATWFYAASKDLLLLRSEGGWQSVAMVERYAHLMQSDTVLDIALVWGASHPRIGALASAESVQASRRA